MDCSRPTENPPRTRRDQMSDDTNGSPNLRTRERAALDIAVRELVGLERGLFLEGYSHTSGLIRAALDKIRAVMPEAVPSAGSRRF
jgi:hypothetical protein